MPNYQRNRKILGVVLVVLLLGVIAFAASSTGRKADRPTPTTMMVTVLPTTVAPTTSSTWSYDELMEELSKGEGPSRMTLSKFNSIPNGTKESDFTAQVSSCEKSAESRVAGISGSIYQCNGFGAAGANALFQFQDGKLIAKSQVGLRD